MGKDTADAEGLFRPLFELIVGDEFVEFEVRRRRGTVIGRVIYDKNGILVKMCVAGRNTRRRR